MNKEQIKQLAELQSIFEKRCSEVTNILGKMDAHCGTEFSNTDTYRLDGTVVMAEGDEYWSYGGHEHHSQKFPSNFLWKDDEEIKQYVEDELKKREQAKIEERLRMEKLVQEALEKRDREEYERLKKKFG